MHVFNIHLFYCIRFCSFHAFLLIFFVCTAMDEQQYLKKRSLEARSKRRLILNQKRPSRFKISTEGEKMPRHANDGIVKYYY